MTQQGGALAQKAKKKTFAQDFQERISNMFVEVLAEQHPEIAGFVTRSREIQKLNSRAERDEKNLALWNEMGPEQRVLFMDAMGKMGDLNRRARKIAGTQILDAHSDIKNTTADRFEYVFQKLRTNQVSSEEVQDLVDQNAQSWFSLTAHPTNPTSLSYTKRGLKVDKVLGDAGSSADDLRDALRGLVVRRNDAGAIMEEDLMVGGKKRVADEVEEAMLVVDVIYDTVPEVKKSLRDALDKFGYRDVEIKHSLVSPHIWAAGDGDGNPNADKKALEEAVGSIRSRIRDRYLHELDEIKEALDERGRSGPAKAVTAMYSRVNHGFDELSMHSFKQDLKRLREDIRDDDLKEKVDDLVTRTEVFGKQYVNIDIRHNAKDLTIALARILDTAGEFSSHRGRKSPLFSSEEEFLAASAEKRAEFIRERFKDDHFLGVVKQISEDSLIRTGEEKATDSGPTAARILGRLRVAAENPDMFGKLIIAETASVADSLGALLLLKATGNEVGTKEARIDVVPLFETREDLEAAPGIVKSLLNDETFRAHVDARGHFIPMIAKSDTVRKAGIGIQGLQESTVGVLHRVCEEEGVQCSVMFGGGHSLQRGGGKMTEQSYVAARAVAREGGHKMGPTLCTIQGHQPQLLFSPEMVGKSYMEGSIAQNIYAAARLKGLCPWRPVPESEVSNMNEEKGKEYATEFFKTSGRAYENYATKDKNAPDDTKKNHRLSFVDLAQFFPWPGVELGNASSRPSKRADVGVKDPFDYRAITLDRLMAHSGTYFTGILGIREGLEKINEQAAEKGDGGAAELYVFNKSFRDAMRNQAAFLHMMDFDIAWRLLDKPHPTPDQVKELAGQFDIDKRNSPEVTLAYLEVYAHDTAKLIYNAITGKDAAEVKDFDLQTPLRTAWPNLSEEMAMRERQSEMARMVEAELTKEQRSKAANDNTHEPSAHEALLIKLAYAGADFTNAPVGIGLTLTDKQVVNGAGKGNPLADFGLELTDGPVSHKLKMPNCLGGGVNTGTPG